jgi:hypothetical protein
MNKLTENNDCIFLKRKMKLIMERMNVFMCAPALRAKTRKMKYLRAVFLTAVMAVWMIGNANAANLYIDGSPISDGESTLEYEWDRDNGKLTLKGNASYDEIKFTYSSLGVTGITVICNADVTVGEISGTNGLSSGEILTVTIQGSGHLITDEIAIEGGVTITGGISVTVDKIGSSSGTVTIGGNAAVDSYGTLAVTSSSVSIENNATIAGDGLACSGALTVKNRGSVSVSSTGYGITAGGITVEDNASVSASGATALKSTGNIVIKDNANVSARGAGSNAGGIYCDQNITVSGNARLLVSATGDGYAIVARGPHGLTISPTGHVRAIDTQDDRLLLGRLDWQALSLFETAIYFPDPALTEGFRFVIVETPEAEYEKVSDTEFWVSVGSTFSFRIVFDYNYGDNSSVVAVNGVQILPDKSGVYTLEDIQDTRHVTVAAGRNNIDGHPIMRRVKFNTGAGIRADLPTGIHYVQSMRDFVFTAEATIPGTELAVEVNREWPGYLKITPLGDWRYLVEVRSVQQDIEIRALSVCYDLLSGVSGAGSSGAWGANGTLYVSAATQGTALVYAVSGQLVKKLPHAAGETVTAALPTGVYIVEAEGKTYRVKL